MAKGQSGKTSSKAANKETTKGKAKAVAPPQKTGKGMIAALVIILAVIGAVVLAMNAGSMAKGKVEQIAAKTLGVPVSIASLDISLQDRQIIVGGIKVGNPQGYKHPQAMTIETVTIAADTLGKELLTFNRIGAEGVTLNLEVTPDGTNLSDLRRHADKQASAREKTAQSPVKVIIRELGIDDATLVPYTILAHDSMRDVALPPVRIRGIGEKENGVAPSEAIAQVTELVVQVAVKRAFESGYLRGMAPESMKMLQQELGLPPSLLEQVREIGDRVNEKVKELFAE